jgi:hypothetical protein
LKPNLPTPFILKNMRCVLRRQLLAGLLLSALGWAVPTLACPLQQGKPAPSALADAGHFTSLCETKLKLAPAQAAALRTYLDQEVNYQQVLAANGIATTSPVLGAETGQLNQVMARLLSPTQFRDFGKLQQTAQAQTYLRSMALLPSVAPSNMAKTKSRPRHTSEMIAQRLDEAE